MPADPEMRIFVITDLDSFTVVAVDDAAADADEAAAGVTADEALISVTDVVAELAAASVVKFDAECVGVIDPGTSGCAD